MIDIFNRYTMWLSQRVATAKSPDYVFLLTELNKIEYYFIEPTDKNRVAYALDLRREFAQLEGSNVVYDVMPGSCTALELLVYMAEAADFTLHDDRMGPRPEQFFWTFIDNLGLSYLTNSNWSFEASNFIFSTINKWFDRRYNPNGHGSPWPILNTRVDLTSVPMWDQMQWWLAENEEVL